MGQSLLLEVRHRLAERRLEVAPPIDPRAERVEVIDDAVEAVTLDQLVGEQEGELVGRLRAVAQMTVRESARSAKRLQIEARLAQRRVPSHALHRRRPPTQQGVQAQALEHMKRRPLRHALRQPLLGAPLAARHLDLGDVRQLVCQQAQPVGARHGAGVMEQQLTPLANARREIAELGGAQARHLPILDEAFLEDLARRVHIDGHALRHGHPQIADENGGDPAHGLLVRREFVRALWNRQRRRLHAHGHDRAASRTARDGQAQGENQKSAAHPAGR